MMRVTILGAAVLAFAAGCAPDAKATRNSLIVACQSKGEGTLAVCTCVADSLAKSLDAATLAKLSRANAATDEAERLKLRGELGDPAILQGTETIALTGCKQAGASSALTQAAQNMALAPLVPASSTATSASDGPASGALSDESVLTKACVADGTAGRIDPSIAKKLDCACVARLEVATMDPKTVKALIRASEGDETALPTLFSGNSDDQSVFVGLRGQAISSCMSK